MRIQSHFKKSKKSYKLISSVLSSWGLKNANQSCRSQSTQKLRFYCEVYHKMSRKMFNMRLLRSKVMDLTQDLTYLLAYSRLEVSISPSWFFKLWIHKDSIMKYWAKLLSQFLAYKKAIGRFHCWIQDLKKSNIHWFWLRLHF